jgi:hypothetical protein
MEERRQIGVDKLQTVFDSTVMLSMQPGVGVAYERRNPHTVYRHAGVICCRKKLT